MLYKQTNLDLTTRTIGFLNYMQNVNINPPWIVKIIFFDIENYIKTNSRLSISDNFFYGLDFLD
jgi:hypothetical protein